MIDWPNPIVNDLARRRAIIVIGSGVSRHSTGNNGARPPTWREFLRQALEECPVQTPPHIEQAIASGDLLHACEWLKNRFDEQWNGYLRSKFQTPQFAPSKIHETIIKLDCRIVFSLNFDDIYERAANSIQHGSHIVKHYYDPDMSEFLRGNGRYIVKIHGSLNSPERLIFTQNDYAKARMHHSAFYQAFDAALLTHSLIFVVTGYSDPDVNLILENQNFNFPSNQPHYFLTSENQTDDLKASLRKNRNLKMVEYDPVDQNHSGLVAELDALAELVEFERQHLTQSVNW